MHYSDYTGDPPSESDLVTCPSSGLFYNGEVVPGYVFGACPHCGVFHGRQSCPRIRAIELYPNGTIKRIEYHPYYPSPTQGT